MDWKQKLTSRKFWAAIINFVTQLLIAFRMTESEAAQVAAVIMAGAGVIAYIVGEGLADAAGASADVVISAEDVADLIDDQPPDEGDE
ncbi:MAG: hypothetical protein IJJ45_11650 [Clostridia bacterium]|nr:hypothetical protein [Clostridia bacterium]